MAVCGKLGGQVATWEAERYVHGGSGPRAEPVVPGPSGIAGHLLTSYTRDFSALLAR